MANSQYEYVKQFELSDALLPHCWLVCRVDGHGFSSFAQRHGWLKPNDDRALQLMNAAACALMAAYPEVVLAYGQSDEFSFVLPPSCALYGRRREKLSSSFASLFSSLFTLQYAAFFPPPAAALQSECAPHFDGRCVQLPTDAHMRDYLSWRQVDCHVNNLYNTAYWLLRQRRGLSGAEARAALDGGDSAAKHELLFALGCNYNDEQQRHRKGSVIIWERYQRELKDGGGDEEEAADSGGGAARSAPRSRRRPLVLHEDLIAASFFLSHPGIIPHVSSLSRRRDTQREDGLQASTRQYRQRDSTPPLQAPQAGSSEERKEEEGSQLQPPLASPAAAPAVVTVQQKPSFFSLRRLSATSHSLSPGPSPSPLLPSSPTSDSPAAADSAALADPQPVPPVTSRSSSINASALYRDLVQRAYSQSEQQEEAELLSPSLQPRSSSGPPTASSTPMTPLHRRLHRSGFVALELTAEEGEADLQSPLATSVSSPSAAPSAAEPQHSAASSPVTLPAASTSLAASPVPPAVRPSPPAAAASLLTADSAPANSGGTSAEHQPALSSDSSFQAEANAAAVTSPSASVSASGASAPGAGGAQGRPAALTEQARYRTIARRESAAAALSIFDSVTADASPSGSPTASPLSPSLSPAAPRLFSHFLVLGCLPSPALLPGQPASWTEEPRILLEFPHQSLLRTAELPAFAFPTGVQVDRLEGQSLLLGSMQYGQRLFQRTERVHVFVLKLGHEEASSQLFTDELQYGLCVRAREATSIRDADGRMHELSCETAYCLLSRFPFFSLHADVLFSLLMLLHLHRAQKLAAAPPQGITRPSSKPLGPHQVPACVSLLTRYHHLRVPPVGAGFVLKVGDSLPSIQFERAGGGDEAGAAEVSAVSGREAALCCAQWSLVVAWSFVSGDMLADMLECGLRETKLIVVDENLALVSAAVLSLLPLLRPLSWASIILPILPSKMHDFLDAPVPVICGVPDLPERLSTRQHLDSNTAVWLASSNKLWLPVHFKSLLPGRSRLVSGLKRRLAELRKGRPQLVPGKVAAGSLQYKCTAAEWEAYAGLLAEVNTYVAGLCEYVEQTDAGRLPREKDKEPLAACLRQTQMMQRWLGRHTGAAVIHRRWDCSVLVQEDTVSRL